jgi:TolB-like protein
MRRESLVLFAALAFLPALSHAGDSETLARIAAKLTSQAEPKLQSKKIAILPFEYVDKRSSPGGRIVAERLIEKFVEDGELRVIERSLIDKLLGELKLQNSGAIDADTAKQLGKGLGAEAIVTGTLEVSADGRKTIVNARIVRTDTFEILGAASDGLYDVVEATQRDPYQGQVGGGPQANTTDDSVSGFFDVFVGGGGAKLDTTFENSAPVSASGVGFCFGGACPGASTPPSFNKFTINDMKTGGSVPIGVRFGRFGEVFGGDVEVSLWQHATTVQSGLSGTLDGAPVTNISLNTDKYLQVTVLNLVTGDLLVRVPINEDVFPYFGIGGGLTLTNVKSAAGGVLNHNLQVLDQTAPGWSLRIPIGMRFKVGRRVGLFAEGRFVWSGARFDRGILGEKDTILLSGAQLLGGLSFFF